MRFRYCTLCLTIGALSLAMMAHPAVSRPPQSVDTLEFLHAGIRERMDRKDYAGAVLLARQAAGDAERLKTPAALRLKALLDLARAEEANGAPKAAIETYLRAEALNETVHPSPSIAARDLLTALTTLYFREERYEEALLTAQRALSNLRRVVRDDGADLANAYHNVAITLDKLAVEPDAERMHKRALNLRRRFLVPDHPLTLASHEALGAFYQSHSRKDEAARHVRLILAARERRPEEWTAIADARRWLAALVSPAEAEPLLRSAIAHSAAHADSDAAWIANAHYALAENLWGRGKLQEAEEHAREAHRLAGVFSPDDRSYYTRNLAELLQRRGKYADAIPIFREYFELRKQAYGAYDQYSLFVYPQLITALKENGNLWEAEQTVRFVIEHGEKVEGNSFLLLPHSRGFIAQLADILESQGRIAEAEQLYRHVMETTAMTQKWFGIKETKLDYRLFSRFAGFLGRNGKLDEAAELAQKAVRIAESIRGEGEIDRILSPDELDRAHVYSSYAHILSLRGEYALAESYARKSLDIRRRDLEPDDRLLVDGLRELAAVSLAQGKTNAAQALLDEALRVLARSNGLESSREAGLAADLGKVFAYDGNMHEALRHFERAVSIYSRQIGNLGGTESVPGMDSSVGRVAAGKFDFGLLVRAYFKMGGSDPAASRDRAFLAFQRAQLSSASIAVTQMSARQSMGDAKLAEVLRNRQDLVREWHAIDESLLTLLSVLFTERNEQGEEELRRRQAEISRNLKAIDDRLARDFPGYVAFSNPEPLPIADVQALLSEDEVLLGYMDTQKSGPLPAETYVWVIARHDARWIRLALPPDEIESMVNALRLGLGIASPVRAKRAAESFDEPEGETDLAIAHELYRVLVGPAGDMLQGKRLLFVPSNSMAKLPFHLLLSAQPDPGIADAEAYRNAPWLILSNAMARLPSVSALKALRGGTQTHLPGKPYIGVGNPLLTGPGGTDLRAAQMKGCNDTTLLASAGFASAAADERGASQFFRGDLGDVAALRELVPLPETVGELCAVGRSLGGHEDDLFLGAAATETALKQADAEGMLSGARVLHFATHGLVAGDLKGLAEPALVLTPPEKPTSGDDGLLTASEIAALHLNADWVILSACNTGAGGKGNAEALSGLARSFFYAGSRALLVSHWPVDSRSAVEITTGTVAALADHPQMSRAEALRQTLIGLIRNGGERSRPAYWAPFELIGDGN